MKQTLIGVFLVIFIFLLAVGCAPQQQPAETTSQPVMAEEIEEPVMKEVIPTVELTSVPEMVKDTERIEINWKVPSGEPLTASHTAIHYDSVSHAGEFSTDVGPQDSGYKSLTREYVNGEFSVPGDFATDFPVLTGASKVYLRAHAIIDGRNYWTDEVSINVESTVPPEPPLKEFTIEANDNGFYPTRTITVQKGDIVRILFKVRKAGTYYGGLDIRGSAWGDTGRIKPGEEATVEFTADKSFDFKSYWPASNALKATGKVVVEE